MLMFCSAYLCQLRCWVWVCRVADWEPGKLWVYLTAAFVSANYSAWTRNTAVDWLEEWRAKK